MILKTTWSLQRPQCPSMGLWWEVEIDLFRGIRESLAENVIFVLNTEREV